MNNNNGTVNFNGVFSTLLTILFIALKLTGVITWSWWWVLSPIWISILLVILIIAIVVIVKRSQVD